jgi:hypothetical protein
VQRRVADLKASGLKDGNYVTSAQFRAERSEIGFRECRMPEQRADGVNA